MRLSRRVQILLRGKDFPPSELHVRVGKGTRCLANVKAHLQIRAEAGHHILLRHSVDRVIQQERISRSVSLNRP
jgi:hypothetical protein